MKDQYVADVNDYFKYALLRTLTDGGETAVAWMLTPSDDRSDGQRLAYLRQPHRFAHLDPSLFEALGALIREGRRTVAAVEQAGILEGALYASDVLHDDLESRRAYFTRLWKLSAKRRFLFFDPDNGLAVASITKGRRSSAKYLFWDELNTAYRRGHSLIVYQHFPRQPRDAFVRGLASRIHALTGCPRVLAIATSHVVFVLLPQEEDAFSMHERIDAFSAHAAPYKTVVTSLEF